MGAHRECTLHQAPLHLLLDIREVCVRILSSCDCLRDRQTNIPSKEKDLTSRNLYLTNQYLETEKGVQSCPGVGAHAVLHPAGVPCVPAQLAVPVTTGESAHGPEQSRRSPVHTDWDIALRPPADCHCQPWGQTDGQDVSYASLGVIDCPPWIAHLCVTKRKEKQLFWVLCHSFPLSSVKPCTGHMIRICTNAIDGHFLFLSILWWIYYDKHSHKKCGRLTIIVCAAPQSHMW